MPVTQGHGNPNWTREETLLALDLLYRSGKPLDRRHTDVLELSALLRAAKIHPPGERTDKFRNPDGVALKLQNLLSAVEPGRGLTYSITDMAVVTDFPKEKAGDLAVIVEALRKSFTGDAFTDSPDDEEFVEGAWLTSRHRQRDARLRKKLLGTLKNKPLQCVICDFSPPILDRPLQESFFEAHHKTPLAAAEGMRTTRVSELALLCACCHRFLHKLISSNRRWVGVEEGRAVLQSSREAHRVSPSHPTRVG